MTPTYQPGERVYLDYTLYAAWYRTTMPLFGFHISPDLPVFIDDGVVFVDTGDEVTACAFGANGGVRAAVPIRFIKTMQDLIRQQVTDNQVFILTGKIVKPGQILRVFTDEEPAIEEATRVAEALGAVYEGNTGDVFARFVKEPHGGDEADVVVNRLRLNHTKRIEEALRILQIGDEFHGGER